MDYYKWVEEDIELTVKADELFCKMMKALFEEQKQIPVRLMICLASRFSAQALLMAQDSSQADVVDSFMKLVKQYMELMKTDGTFRSLDNEEDRAKRAEFAKQILEAFKKRQAAQGEDAVQSPTDDEEMVN